MLITLAFLAQSVLTVLERSATQFSSSEKKGGLAADASFTPEDGFKIALQVQAPDSLSRNLKPSAKMRAVTKEGKVHDIPLDIVPCKHNADKRKGYLDGFY